MAETELLKSPVAEAAQPQSFEGASPAQVGPVPMLGAATSSLGSAAIRQKVARRLARRAVNLSSIGDSLAASAGPGQVAGAAAAPSAVDVAEKGFSGTGHDVPYRSEMEQSFGADFSSVKAYTDGSAGKANESLNSHAYAMGNQVAFKSASPDKATVAHELTHVLQQSASPAYKSAGDDGIDTSGEAQAEAVEAAVASGKPASSVLGGSPTAASGAPAAKKIARKEDSKFSMGMSFSKEKFEKSYEYELWKAHIPEIPTPVPGVMVMFKPEVKVKGKMGAEYGGENKGNLALSLGVDGTCLGALAGGVPEMVKVYGGLEGRVTGEAVFNSQSAPEEHGAAGGEHAAGGQHGVEGGPKAEAKPGGWNLNASISTGAAVKIGIQLGPGGMIDNSIELGSIEIFKLTGIYFDGSGFRKEKLGFEWGKEMKAAFDAIKHAWERAKQLASAGWDMAKGAAKKVYNGAADFVSYVTSW